MAYICLGLPGGVGLYWATSSLIGIVQQRVISKRMKLEMEKKPVLYRNKPAGGKGDAALEPAALPIKPGGQPAGSQPAGGQPSGGARARNAGKKKTPPGYDGYEYVKDGEEDSDEYEYVYVYEDAGTSGDGKNQRGKK
jgi:membrane protein insertase Oxa1/YidC/SpoIIIJ